MASVTIECKVEWLFEPVTCSGESCLMCEDNIYGSGYKMILVVVFGTNSHLPQFRDSNLMSCSSCKEAYDNGR